MLQSIKNELSSMDMYKKVIKTTSFYFCVKCKTLNLAHILKDSIFCMYRDTYRNTYISY